MSQDTNTVRLANQRSQPIEIDRRPWNKSLGGIATTTYEQVTGHGDTPIAGEFGVFEPYVYNERNTSESRKRWVVFNTETSPIVTKQSLGPDGSVITESAQVVPVGSQTPTSALTTLSSTVEKLDGNHEIWQTQEAAFVGVPSYRQAADEFEGLDIKVTELPVTTTQPDNTGAKLGVTSQGETDTRMRLRSIEVTTPAGSDEEITSRDWLPNVQSAQVFKRVSQVGTNDTPSLSYLDIAVQDKKTAVGVKLRTRFSVAAWVAFTDTEQDPDTGASVEVVKTIEDKDTWVPSGDAGVEETSKQLDTQKIEVTRRTLDAAAIGRPFYESKNIQYKFPGWLKPGSEYRTSQIYKYTSGATDYPVIVTTGLKEKFGQTLTVPAELVITYHKLRPILPEVFQFYTTTFRVNTMNDGLVTIYNAASSGTGTLAEQLSGRSSIEISDMITDAAPCLWTNTQTGGIFKWQTIGPTAPTWLPYVLGTAFTGAQTEDIPASIPTATEYIAMMNAGTKILVGVELTKWKYNLWRQVRTYIKMPNLITPAVA